MRRVWEYLCSVKITTKLLDPATWMYLQIARLTSWLMILFAVFVLIVGVRAATSNAQVVALRRELHETKTALQGYQEARSELTTLRTDNKKLRSENELLAVALSDDRPVSRGALRSYADFPLLSPSWATAEQLDRYVADTPLEGTGRLFVEAELRTGINAVGLMAWCVHEGQWGKSQLSREKHNCFGFQAYDSSPYESARAFDNLSDGILYVAAYIKREYLTEGGHYFNGLTLRGVNIRYAQDQSWHTKVADIWNRAARVIYVQK